MKISRREFLKNACIATAVLPVIQACTPKEEVKTKPSETPAVVMVSEDAPGAKALKYVADAARGDAKLKVLKQNTEAQNQFCNNCLFYKSVKENEYGSCQVVQPGMVASNGWCISWALKVSAKV